MSSKNDSSKQIVSSDQRNRSSPCDEGQTITDRLSRLLGDDSAISEQNDSTDPKDTKTNRRSYGNIPTDPSIPNTSYSGGAGSSQVDRHRSSTSKPMRDSPKRDSRLRSEANIPSCSKQSPWYESPSLCDESLPKTIDESLFSVTNSTVRRSTLKNLDSSSGSDDDLNLEARRIMRQRKKEKERLEKLGPMIPLVVNSDSDTALAEEGTSYVENNFPAIALRVKRAETELIPEIMISEIFKDDLMSHHSSADLSRKSAFISTSRKPSRKSGVNFGLVEQLQFEDDESVSSTADSEKTAES